MSPSNQDASRPHMLVRLKPYDPTVGNVSRSKSISGISFDEGQWVPIYLDSGNSSPLLEYLKSETQEVNAGPLAFDVCTPAGAAEIRRRERMANLSRPVGQSPHKPAPPPPGSVDAGGYTPLNEPAPEHVLDLPAEIVAEEIAAAEAVDAALANPPAPDPDGLSEDDEQEPSKKAAPKARKTPGPKPGSRRKTSAKRRGK